MKKSLILFLLFFMVGCAPQYLVGYHYLGDEEAITGLVSEKTENLTKPFEEKCIQALIKADMGSFRNLFTEKLSKAVPEEELVKLEEALQSHFKPDGRYNRLKASSAHGERLHAELDTAVFVNGFEHYDYIEAQYLLYGASITAVHLYLTEVGGNPRLSGFEVRDAFSAKNGESFSIKYLVPETVDKAGMLGKTIIRLPQ